MHVGYDYTMRVKIHSGSSLEVDPFVKVFHEFSKSVYSLISRSPVWNSQTYIMSSKMEWP